MAEPPSRNLPPKKEVALALLEGESVFIHLDPRREGVLVPKSFGKQPQLVLQIGLNLAIRIPDLAIDEEGVSCTLSFNRAPFWCRMPWASIYALVGPDGRGMLWPDDVPPEVAAQMRAGRTAGKSQGSTKRPRPRLTSVKEPSSDGGHPITEDLPVPDPGVRARDIDRPPRRGRPPQQRPALAAVPSSTEIRADAKGARIDRSAPLGAHNRPGPNRPGGRPGPPAASPPAAKKPKRELPPYLRVVK